MCSQAVAVFLFGLWGWAVVWVVRWKRQPGGEEVRETRVTVSCTDTTPSGHRLPSEANLLSGSQPAPALHHSNAEIIFSR